MIQFYLKKYLPIALEQLLEQIDGDDHEQDQSKEDLIIYERDSEGDSDDDDNDQTEEKSEEQ